MDKELHKIKNKIQLLSNSCFKKATLFQGIELYFYTAKTPSFSIQHPKLKHIMEINYCRSGRIGWKMNSKQYMMLQEKHLQFSDLI